jgi:hypothetical protein
MDSKRQTTSDGKIGVVMLHWGQPSGGRQWLSVDNIRAEWERDTMLAVFPGTIAERLIARGWARDMSAGEAWAYNMRHPEREPLREQSAPDDLPPVA